MEEEHGEVEGPEAGSKALFDDLYDEWISELVVAESSEAYPDSNLQQLAAKSNGSGRREPDLGFSVPFGVSGYELSKLIPENYRSALPTIEEIEEGLTLGAGEEN